MTSRGPQLVVDDGFTAHLGGHSLEALDSEPGVVVGLWPDGRMALQNSAWQRFALENAGSDMLERWPIGSDLLSGISGALRGYYGRAFARAAARNEAWEQSYHCHSSRLSREHRLRVLPLEGSCLLLIHSDVVVPTPFGSGELVTSARYVAADGMIRQCSNCRRSQRVGCPGTWDWVPQFVDQAPPNVSHGICATCRNQYYPGL